MSYSLVVLIFIGLGYMIGLIYGIVKIQKAEKRIKKRVRDLRYTNADILQMYRTGFEDGYDFRRNQEKQMI